MKRTISVAALVVFLAAHPGSAGGPPEDEDGPHRPSSSQAPPPKPSPGPYRKIERKITEGMKLFLVTDKRYMGEVVEWRQSHPFPDGKAREGVKVKLAGDKLSWIPADTVRRIYLTK